MMRPFAGLILLGLLGILRGAGVEIAELPATADGQRLFRLENRFVAATFSTRGGRLTGLLDKRSGKELTWDHGQSAGSGALKDQFAPNHFLFRDAHYAGKILTGTGQRVQLELLSPVLPGPWQYIRIRRLITLEADVSRLDCQLEVTNQRESMEPLTVNYWSHNFFGVPGEENRFLVPLASGVLPAVPTAEKNGRGSRFHTEPVRGWSGMLGSSGTGVLLLAEYRRFELAYSWYCLDTAPLNTVELRLIPETIAEGETLRTQLQIGVCAEMETVDGAGAVACGAVFLPEKREPGVLPVRVAWHPFQDQAAQVRFVVDGQALQTVPLQLQAGRKTEQRLTLEPVPAGAATLRVELLDGEGRLLADLLKPLAPATAAGQTFFPPLEARREADRADAEPWQFDPLAETPTPHERWLQGDAGGKVLFLVPTNGIRDVLEMQQRFALQAVSPTVFPRNYSLAWRKNTTLGLGAEQDGTQFVAGFLRERWEALVIGSENQRQTDRVAWKKYPAAVRATILEQVRAGTGLLLINPTGEDEALQALLDGLVDDEELGRASMDFAAAPYFAKARIRTGQHGQGRVVAITYPTSAFLAPCPPWRGNPWQLRVSEHRFQEYQFAILGRLLRWCMGRDPVLTALQARPGLLVVESQRGGPAEIAVYNRHTRLIETQAETLKAGRNELALPPLQDGKNYIHVKLLPDVDFAFTTCDFRSPERIEGIDMSASFARGEVVEAVIRVSKPESAPRLRHEVIDGVGRLVHSGSGAALRWEPRQAVVSRHVLRARLEDEQGRCLAEREQDFYLPDVYEPLRNYPVMLWTGGDSFPEYTYPYRYEAARQFGFSFIYEGSYNNTSKVLLRHANVPVGFNGAAGPQMFYQPGLFRHLQQWNKTNDKRFLVRVPCPNDPEEQGRLQIADQSEVRTYATRKIFQLGDEMSMTMHNNPTDFCFCRHCLQDFRQLLQKQGFTLEKLNQTWDTAFATWDDVMPMTYGEAIQSANPAPYVMHRLYMDGLFARSLQKPAAALKAMYPGCMVGPTGVNSPPHVYGGNWNFWLMRDFDCASFYGTPRIPVSFRREQRVLMQYRGYRTPEGSTRYSFWEGLFVGERGSNNWFDPVFILPDLRLSTVRRYYRDLLWELRGGSADLLYHSRKDTAQVAILHSQPALIANFLKVQKNGYYEKELSFARALEDCGLSYRFIAPEELEAGVALAFKALILPESSALGEAEIQACLNFVEQGGILLADYETGTLNEWGKTRPVPALDALFGIDSRSCRWAKVTEHNLGAFTIKQARAGLLLKEARHDGEAVSADGVAIPLCTRRQHGKGEAIRLNFVTEYNQLRSSGGEAGFCALLRRLLPLPPRARVEAPFPVMQACYLNGDQLYIGLLPEAQGHRWTEQSREACQRLRSAVPLTLAEERHLYDVRAGRYLGYGRQHQIELVPSDGTLLAALPYQVRQLRLQVPEQAAPGSVVVVEAAVEADRSPGHHLLLLTVLQPDGSEQLAYRHLANTADGSQRFTIPLALNDPSGVWQISVKDAATGVTARAALTLP